jgi:hypothetical protein
MKYRFTYIIYLYKVRFLCDSYVSSGESSFKLWFQNNIDLFNLQLSDCLFNYSLQDHRCFNTDSNVNMFCLRKYNV